MDFLETLKISQPVSEPQGTNWRMRVPSGSCPLGLTGLRVNPASGTTDQRRRDAGELRPSPPRLPMNTGSQDPSSFFIPLQNDMIAQQDLN